MPWRTTRVDHRVGAAANRGKPLGGGMLDVETYPIQAPSSAPIQYSGQLRERLPACCQKRSPRGDGRQGTFGIGPAVRPI